MKKAKEYKNWEGTYSCKEIKRLGLPKNTIVWFSSLCEGDEKMEHPSDCNHSPIFLDDYLKNYPHHEEAVFYHIIPNNKINPIDLLNNRTAKISFIAALIGLLIVFKQCKDEVFAESPKSNISCDCEYQDISVKSSGKKFKFRVVYLTREKKWKFESTELLETNEKVSDVLPSFIKNIPDFQSSTGVIAVGLASQEGKVQEEEVRATGRADKIADVLRTASTSKELYTLSLGKYLGSEELNTNLTGYQRRVIVIGILEKEPNLKKAQIEKALQLALEDTEGLDFATERYSDFQFDKIK